MDKYEKTYDLLCRVHNFGIIGLSYFVKHLTTSQNFRSIDCNGQSYYCLVAVSKLPSSERQDFFDFVLKSDFFDQWHVNNRRWFEYYGLRRVKDKNCSLKFKI